jgi:hypothetical protein
MAPGRAIRRLGPRVLVLDPVPKPPFGVPGCLSVHLPKARVFTVPLDQGIDEAGLAAELGPVAAAGGTSLDTLPWLCTTTTCAFMVDNLLIHRDGNQLTDTYATCLAQAKTDGTGGGPRSPALADDRDPDNVPHGRRHTGLVTTRLGLTVRHRRAVRNPPRPPCPTGRGRRSCTPGGSDRRGAPPSVGAGVARQRPGVRRPVREGQRQHPALRGHRRYRPGPRSDPGGTGPCCPASDPSPHGRRWLLRWPRPKLAMARR